MVNIPSTPEIITVNSEALQTQIRDLLPSQNGFGSELQATNVITPIIDLTAAAEGSTVPEYQAQALAFGSQTAFQVVNTTTTLINSPGFYRITGQALVTNAASAPFARFSMSDGLTTKSLFTWQLPAGTSVRTLFENFDFVVFLTTGDTFSAVSNNATAVVSGSHRQIATGDGSIVNPVGFPL